MDYPDALAARLGKQLIATLPEGKFLSAFADVYDPADTVVPGPRMTFGVFGAYTIGSTHVVVEAPSGWSFFESADATRQREHLARWADFARGYWVKRTPTSPGTYPVLDRAGHRSRDHVLITVNGRLRDTDSGFLAPGVVSNWVGSWWSLAYPSLPEAM